ncbi:MAG TPA: hypothetical protein VK922_02400 [Gemmatimonadaceae bacterium]|nr:hypothetical protein [Gemmatimonadaceae bacterium]
MRSRRMCAMLAGIVLASLAGGCSRDDRTIADDPTEREVPAIEASQSAPEDAAPDAQIAGDAPDTMHRPSPEPGALTTVPTEAVADWFGPGGTPFEIARRTADPASVHARRFGARTMQIALRTQASSVGQYPCTSCHLGRLTRMTDDRVPDAHANITPVHPAQTGGVCSTCHAPDNVELLTLKLGERTTLDHAYRLCAQCHVGQVEAWAGGAHGKRLDGWQGRRVVMGCADCHDPHAPTLEARIPFRAPRLQRTRGPDR